MEIKFVNRAQVKSTKRRASKFKPLMEALDKLKPGGDAVEVAYASEKSVNSMRTAVYQYNQENNVKIKSGKNAKEQKIYFFREK
ncbi:MAG: hypothetical protein RI513_00600 [Balneolaceae bacterium]|nr:hypothetical protein [Balneolaceae bacterium]MDR9446841.1 hypothetical protein [Balneolaceae bacterium]